MLVLNAGIFHGEPARSSILPTEEWRKAMSVNLDANLLLMRTLPSVPENSPPPGAGGWWSIGSKNVPAPGSGGIGLFGFEGPR